MTRRKNIVIATIKTWNINNACRLKSALKRDCNVFIFTKPGQLNYKTIKKLNPGYIFFPHWSWGIPEKIYKNYECVVFHSTDLPYGRGGSPLQNLIARGASSTKITAIRVVREMDAGDIYLKRGLKLNGSAAEIFRRASKIIFEDMIPRIMKNSIIPVPQKGVTVKFNRRRPEQSDISKIKDKKNIYDYIRMLDAEGYPLAFVETPGFKIEFSNAKLGRQYVLADARIRVKI